MLLALHTLGPLSTENYHNHKLSMSQTIRSYWKSLRPRKKGGRINPPSPVTQSHALQFNINTFQPALKLSTQAAGTYVDISSIQVRKCSVLMSLMLQFPYRIYSSQIHKPVQFLYRIHSVLHIYINPCHFFTVRAVSRKYINLCVILKRNYMLSH